MAHPKRTTPDGDVDLPEVTLIAATSVAVPQTLRAMRNSMAGIRYADAVLFSDVEPGTAELAGIRRVAIAPIESRDAYSRFMLRDLASHIRTDFVLCVQWDGYVLDAGNWTDAFLKYDYVGAPWVHLGPSMIVGNGGFSLRSRRLLQACASAGLDTGIAEDLAICRDGRDRLTNDFGIAFAPPDLALSFAYERTPRSSEAFGFHGVFNMPELPDMNSGSFVRFYEDLPRDLVGRIENRDLLAHALRKGLVARPEAKVEGAVHIADPEPRRAFARLA
ncbi:MAG: hypothetical protein KGL44_10190, partial [Sphingomonadales bacterium]|nr:hypothetical protein [Sphingomonadales bacterium]